MNVEQVFLKLNSQEFQVPGYAHETDAGADLRSCEENFWLYPGERRVVDTGICFEIPEGHFLMLTPRSGLAAKNGITVVNSPGVVDSSYRNSVKIILLNTDKDTAFFISKGDRIAQAILMPYVKMQFTVVDSLSDTERGLNGCGSTGVK